MEKKEVPPTPGATKDGDEALPVIKKTQEKCPSCSSDIAKYTMNSKYFSWACENEDCLFLDDNVLTSDSDSDSNSDFVPGRPARAAAAAVSLSDSDSESEGEREQKRNIKKQESVRSSFLNIIQTIEGYLTLVDEKGTVKKEEKEKFVKKMVDSLEHTRKNISQ